MQLREMVCVDVKHAGLYLQLSNDDYFALDLPTPYGRANYYNPAYK